MRKLPNLYQELEYIQSSGTQYLDTGIIVDNKTKWTLDNNFIEVLSNGSYNGVYDNKSPILRFDIALGTDGLRLNYGNINIVSDNIDDFLNIRRLYTLDANSNTWSYDSVSGQFPQYSIGTSSRTKTIYLFHRNDTAIIYSKQKTYSSKIYKNNILIQNLIPAKRTTDGVVGMYDTVTDTFFTNAGTGNFIAGPVVTGIKLKLNNNPKIEFSGYSKLEYIESSGNQYIDTGFKPNNNTRVVMEYTLTKLPSVLGNGAYPFGTRISYKNKSFTLMFPVNNANTNIFDFGGISVTWTFATLNVPIKVDVNKNVCTIYYNDTSSTVTAGGQTFSCTTNLYLFEVNTNGTPSIGETEHIQIRSCKIYDNGTLIRDYIPCKDTYNKTCMYDTVSGTFFYNSGTGDFIAGPIVEEGGISSRFLLKCTDLFVKDCPNVNNIKLLKAILDTSGNTLSRIRINANNDVLTLPQARQLLIMSGFNDSMQEQVKPRIVGSITINDYLTQEILTQLQNTLDGCTITATNLIDWDELAIQTLDSTKPNYNPAIAICLQAYGVTLSNPLISNGGRWFLTKSTAANITNFGGAIMDRTSAADTNGIVNDTYSTYNFARFDELIYFTNLTFLTGGAFRKTGLTINTIPEKVSTIQLRCFQNCNLTPYIHFLNPVPAAIGDIFYGASLSIIYVGDGSSESYDNAVLESYKAASGWSSYSSLMDTWWNYLQSQNS